MDEWDANHYPPHEEVLKPMGELGFFGATIPEEYGGEELVFWGSVIITEEIVKVSSITCLIWGLRFRFTEAKPPETF